MKKIFTLLTFVSYSLLSFAQGPLIEGTYLPVRGSAIKQVWNTVPSSVPLPASGTNMTWNYYGYFPNTSNTYKISTFAADTTPYFHHFNTLPDSATHASYLRTPLNNTSDSLYSYYIVDRQKGFYMLGGRSEKARPVFSGTSPQFYLGNDTTYKLTNKDPMQRGELYAPVNISYVSPVLYDTSSMVTYGAAYSGSPFFITVPIKLKRWYYKTLKTVGFGSLIMPDSTFYDNVLLARIQLETVDSLFNDTDGTFISNSIIAQFGLTGQIQSPQIDTVYQYAFLRNNTFGSAYLMYFLGNDTVNLATSFVNGWYTLPFDFGSISGTVYTDNTENTLVTNGEALLYRENSNFAKHDILDRVLLNNGNYKFDSIPYGIYRVAIRADTSIYNRALTTYLGDNIDWLTADTIHTFGDSTSDGHKIHLQYYPDAPGNNNIQGQLYWNFSIQTQGQPNTGTGYERQNNPIPGIDIVVQKQPGGALAEPKTDSNGVFTLSNLPDGQYSLHVDIPGCPHETTYEFCVYGGQTLNVLDYHCGTQYLHALNPIDTMLYSCNPITTSLAEAEDEVVGIQAYPNPYTTNTTLKISLKQKSDVSLEVYNLLGEKVQVLDNSPKLAGTYSYTFSATAINHSAGVYFVRLIANGKTSVLKIVEH
jgi:hypothetical protein